MQVLRCSIAGMGGGILLLALSLWLNRLGASPAFEINRGVLLLHGDAAKPSPIPPKLLRRLQQRLKRQGTTLSVPLQILGTYTARRRTFHVAVTVVQSEDEESHFVLKWLIGQLRLPPNPNVWLLHGPGTHHDGESLLSNKEQARITRSLGLQGRPVESLLLPSHARALKFLVLVVDPKNNVAAGFRLPTSGRLKPSATPNALLLFPREDISFSEPLRAVRSALEGREVFFASIRGRRTSSDAFAFAFVGLAVLFVSSAGLMWALAVRLSLLPVVTARILVPFQKAGALIVLNKSLFLWLTGIYCTFFLTSMVVGYQNPDFQDANYLLPGTPAYFFRLSAGQMETWRLWVSVPFDFIRSLFNGAVPTIALVFLPSIPLPPSGMVIAHTRGMFAALALTPVSELGVPKLCLYAFSTLCTAQVHILASLYACLVLKATIAPRSMGKESAYEAWKEATSWGFPLGIFAFAFAFADAIYVTVLQTILISLRAYGLW